MKTLCIYGCGGLGREIADLAFNMREWKKIIFVDDYIKDQVVDEVLVSTFEDTISKLDRSKISFIVATGDPASRQLLYNKLEKNNLEYISIMYPGFNLSRFSSVNCGTIIHMGAIITVNVHIGKGCLINKHTVIGHDVTVGDYSVISPNVSIGGDMSTLFRTCFYRTKCKYNL